MCCSSKHAWFRTFIMSTAMVAGTRKAGNYTSNALLDDGAGTVKHVSSVTHIFEQESNDGIGVTTTYKL